LKKLYEMMYVMLNEIVYWLLVGMLNVYISLKIQSDEMLIIAWIINVYCVQRIIECLSRIACELEPKCRFICENRSENKIKRHTSFQVDLYLRNEGMISMKSEYEWTAFEVIWNGKHLIEKLIHWWVFIFFLNWVKWKSCDEAKSF